MSGYFGFRTYGKVYRKGYEDDAIEDAYRKAEGDFAGVDEEGIGESDFNTMGSIYQENMEERTKHEPPPPPPPLPIPGRTIPNSIILPNIKIRTRDIRAPRSPLIREKNDISAHAIAMSVKSRKAQLEKCTYEQTLLPSFFAFTDLKQSTDLQEEERIFCSSVSHSPSCENPLHLSNQEYKEIPNTDQKISVSSPAAIERSSKNISPNETVTSPDFSFQLPPTTNVKNTTIPENGNGDRFVFPLPNEQNLNSSLPRQELQISSAYNTDIEEKPQQYRELLPAPELDFEVVSGQNTFASSVVVSSIQNTSKDSRNDTITSAYNEDIVQNDQNIRESLSAPSIGSHAQTEYSNPQQTSFSGYNDDTEAPEEMQKFAPQPSVPSTLPDFSFSAQINNSDSMLMQGGQPSFSFPAPTAETENSNDFLAPQPESHLISAYNNDVTQEIEFGRPVIAGAPDLRNSFPSEEIPQPRVTYTSNLTSDGYAYKDIPEEDIRQSVESGYSEELCKEEENEIQCLSLSSTQNTNSQPTTQFTFSSTDFSFDSSPLPQQTNSTTPTTDFLYSDPRTNVRPFKPEDFAYEQLESELDKIYDANRLKEILLEAARGNKQISVQSLAFQLRKPKKHVLLNPHHRNWNQEYQTLLETPDSVMKFKDLAHLAHDFVYAATTYAKIIISEQCLPNNRKTIPPAPIGGVAGGQKYLCQNIMFKFALDSEICPGLYMYGGQYVDHESAMKAAAHELKGLCQYYSTLIPRLSYPLLANIDYKGFRVIAISVLPIDKETLSYGSCDSGVNVLATNSELNSLMEETGVALNLQKHYAGVVDGKGASISSCGDLEAHEGTDGRYYVLDFARAFPPESPPRDSNLRNPRAVYYRLLRPELVRHNKIPLNPDAFTSWGRKDPQYKKYNLNVLNATLNLLYNVIPEFAKRMDDNYEAIESKLITEIHRIGINVRHLGQIRYHSKSPSCRELIKVEMIVRVVKNQLRDLMRATMREAKGLSQEPFKEVVIQTFNLVLGRDKQMAKKFWKSIQLQISSKFYSGITKQNGLTLFEQNNYKLIRIDDMVSMKRLFKRLIELLGVRITDQAIRQLDDDPSSFEFVDADIVEVYAQPRFMDIIDYAEAMALEKMAQDKTFQREKLRLLELSAKKFVIALHSTPANYLALYHWGEVLFQQAKFTENLHQRIELLKEAATKLESALEMKPNFKFSLLHCSEIYLTLAMSEKENNKIRFKQAAEKFVLAIREDSKYITIFLNYIQTLLLPPTRSFSMLGVLILCSTAASVIPSCLSILEYWGKAIIELVVHFNTFKREELIQVVSEFTDATRTIVKLNIHTNAIAFITELINQLTEIAFYHKHLYFFVAELYRSIQVSNEVNASQMYLHRGLALWEYAKTVNYLEYAKELSVAAENLEFALELDEHSLDDLIESTVTGNAFVQWLDLIESTTKLKSRFLSQIAKTTNSLNFPWCNVSPSAIQMLCEHLGDKIQEITFIHTFNMRKVIKKLIASPCRSLKKFSVELNQDISVDDIRNLCARNHELEILQFIDCAGFSSEILIWISMLPNLRELVLRGIRWLKGTAKFLHVRSKTLEVLDIGYSNIPASELYYFRVLTKLRKFSANCCKNLESGIPELVGCIEGLEEIDVSQAYRDTDGILAALLKQENNVIRSIDVSYCKKLTDKGLEHISSLSENNLLNDLIMASCCRITEGGIRLLALSPCIRNIRVLNLSFNPALEESCFAGILAELDFRILSSLSLGRCKIKTETLKHLIRKRRELALTHLSIPATGVDDLSWLFPFAPNLSRLEIKECPITDNSILSLAKHCSQLTEIDISKCNGLSEESIISVISNASALVTLKMNHCLHITSRTIIAVSDNSRKLQTLEISNNVRIFDADIVHLQNLRELRVLVLSGCRVKSNSLIRLVQSNTHLQQLNIDNTKLVDNKGTIELAKYAKNLHQISACDTLNVSRETFNWVKKYRPQITFLMDTNMDVVSELAGNRRFLRGKIRTHLGNVATSWVNNNLK